jgi:hypothetical protein
MRGAEVAGYILQQDARNVQLKCRLAERGIGWRNDGRDRRPSPALFYSHARSGSAADGELLVRAAPR